MNIGVRLHTRDILGPSEGLSIMARDVRNISKQAAKCSVLFGIAAIAASVPAGAEVLISSGATANITCTSGVCTSTKKSAVLNASQLQSMLAAGNVKVTTDGAKASDILVTAGLSWVSASTLTLDAYQSVTINKAVSVTGSGGLAVVTNDGGTGGMFSFGPKGSVAFLSLASPLTINGNAYTLVDSVSTLASDVTANASGNYALAGKYDASGNSTSVQTPFQGRFEGLGNTISHFTSAGTGKWEGLFANIAISGVVENIRMTGFHGVRFIFNAAGGLAAVNEGLISGSSVNGEMPGIVASEGGLVGYNSGGTIVSSSASVTIALTGKVRGDDEAVLGGLVGSNWGTIESSFATGAVSSTWQASLGGLVGSDYQGTIGSSYATGSVTGIDNTSAGGLVGSTSTHSVVTNSYATGAVTVGSGNNANAGGLIGSNPGSIAGCYSTGSVSGGAGSYVGGLIGLDDTGSYSETYWDTTASGITNGSEGAGNISNDPGITGLSTSQLQARLPAGFSSTIWGENSSINGGLPFLLTLPPPG
jgi:hypothetical protein